MSNRSSENLLISGASGFIGRHLVRSLVNHGSSCIRLTRDKAASVENSIYINEIKDNNIDVVVHLAARAHVLNGGKHEPLSDLIKANSDFTVSVAYEAAAAGARRFIFLSTVGVNGVCNKSPFTYLDKPSPVEPYAFSKFEAERRLKAIAKETGMEVVIIRPPLVYGPNAPGNFGKLIKLAKKNLPLPFGAIDNKRSLVAIDNLIDLIVTCIEHPNAANQTFLVSDGHDVSTTDLLKMLTRAAGHKPRLLPVSVSWLRFAAKLIGKQAVIDRLCGNLEVDITHTKETLNWRPPISLDEGIKRCFIEEELC
ncbi:NAD-dependent epimerase/dehydratase family protein [Kangiella sp.]|uniref:NAD-dependent epimerase/dehydratase family protein n=1 Tax=Kangiella sp. TaxID=1920245 RepID=UPI0019C7590F|nr:NAD-dependent epimerase/dehydratase family protein [Kangiella sp.]MBD3652391.1 NAD-dependent epimerase/dehydratase family protein [Kangiella sp.]